MPSTFPKINLMNATLFQPAEVKFAEYKPLEKNVGGILANGIAHMEQRRQNAYNTRKELATTLAMQRDNFHNSQKAWFADYSNDYLNKLGDAIAAGDYGAAGMLGTQFASEYMHNPEFVARQEFSKDVKNREEFLKTIEHKDPLSYRRFTRQMNKNNYEYLNKAFDKAFNAETNTYHSPDWDPYVDTDYNFMKVVQIAGGMINPDQTSSSVSSSSSGDVFDKNGMKIGTQSHGSGRSSSFSALTEKDIKSNISEMFHNDPNMLAWFGQYIDGLKDFLEDKGELSQDELANLNTTERLWYEQATQVYKKTWLGSRTYKVKGKGEQTKSLENTDYVDWAIDTFYTIAKDAIKNFAYTHRSSGSNSENSNHLNGETTTTQNADGSTTTIGVGRSGQPIVRSTAPGQ